MKLQDRALRLRRLREDRASWRLLRAETAPDVLAILGELFAQSASVPVADAEAVVSGHLPLWREGYGAQDVKAQDLLSSWRRNGYIRESEGNYEITEASSAALRFVDNLEKRELTATATQLKQVQEAIDDLVVRMTQDRGARLDHISRRIEELNEEWKRINDGDVVALADQEQREAIRSILMNSRGLREDFRHLEEEYRDRGRLIREQIAQSQGGRGEVIEGALDTEDELNQTPAGQAFIGFYELLAEDKRRADFRNQIRALLSTEAVRFLDDSEQRFMRRLVSELMNESGRIIQRRKRISANLNTFVKTANPSERRAMDEALKAARQVLVRAGVGRSLSLLRKTGLTLPTGSMALNPLNTFSVRTPKDANYDTKLEEQRPEEGITDQQADRMTAFQLRELATRLSSAFTSDTELLSVADLAARLKFDQGLDEVLGALRIANAVNGYEANDRELVYFLDKQGRFMRADIPKIYLSREMIPSDMAAIGL